LNVLGLFNISLNMIECLAGDIKLLQGRLEEKGANVDTENKLSIWQQETQQQINNLRQQVSGV